MGSTEMKAQTVLTIMSILTLIALAASIKFDQTGMVSFALVFLKVVLTVTSRYVSYLQEKDFNFITSTLNSSFSL